jgi:hypothetical protein
MEDFLRNKDDTHQNSRESEAGDQKHPRHDPPLAMQGVHIS